MIINSCESCKFWAGAEGASSGACRRSAPHVAAFGAAPSPAGFINLNQPRPPKPIIEAIWPSTKRDDWCGEHRSVHGDT